MDASIEVARRFAANLRQARKQADLSQEQVGWRASLHRTEIGLLERGARMPRIDTLLKLSWALEVPVTQLIDGIVWTPGERESPAGSFTISRTPINPSEASES